MAKKSVLPTKLQKIHPPSEADAKIRLFVRQCTGRIGVFSGIVAANGMKPQVLVFFQGEKLEAASESGNRCSRQYRPVPCFLQIVVVMACLHEKTGTVAKIESHFSDNGEILEKGVIVKKGPVHDIHEERHTSERENIAQ